MTQPEIPAEINRVSVKVPPFWDKSPELWFVNIEAQFRVSGISDDCTKYYAIVAALNADVLLHVNDVVLNPPATNMYDTIKRRLIEGFSDSEQQRLKALLSELTLGDDKPSLLLRKMRQLAGTRINEELLQSLWLQRLPSQAQAILSVADGKLDKLALMADKILETTDNNRECSAVARNTAADPIAQMQAQIAALTEQIARLAPGRDRQIRENTARRSSFRYRRRSRTPNRTRTYDNCWYHRKFGENATRCTSPCSFKAQGN